VLVVTRKRGESIVVGDGIEIHVVSVSRNGVRIGVTAPRDVTVHRREVYDMVVAANRHAASSGSQAVTALASSLRSRMPAPGAAVAEVIDAPDRLA
jgi:carbon storage regulator